MMGLIYLLLAIYRKKVRPNEQLFYQVNYGQKTEWVTPDEWIRRNKEQCFYLYQLGERNENTQRNLGRTN